jgi:hypothetical protein
VTTPDDERSPVAVQAAFEELGRLAFAEHSLESVVDKVTELASRVLPGEPITSVTIVRGGRASTVASSGRSSPPVPPNAAAGASCPIRCRSRNGSPAR